MSCVFGLYLKTAEVTSEMNLEFATSSGSYVGKVCSKFDCWLVGFCFVVLFFLFFWN